MNSKQYLLHSRAEPSSPESDTPVVQPRAHFACPVFTVFKCLGTGLNSQSQRVKMVENPPQNKTSNKTKIKKKQTSKILPDDRIYWSDSKTGQVLKCATWRFQGNASSRNPPQAAPAVIWRHLHVLSLTSTTNCLEWLISYYYLFVCLEKTPRVTLQDRVSKKISLFFFHCFFWVVSIALREEVEFLPSRATCH